MAMGLMIAVLKELLLHLVMHTSKDIMKAGMTHNLTIHNRQQDQQQLQYQNRQVQSLRMDFKMEQKTVTEIFIG
jgi:hypothetical protein